MALYHNAGDPATTSFSSEFEILKATHKFLREDAGAEQSGSWNEQLAQKYYSNLFREFAVCDLKHYKSGNVRARLYRALMRRGPMTLCTVFPPLAN